MKLFFPLAIAILVGLWAFGSMAMSPKTLIDTIVMPRGIGRLAHNAFLASTRKKQAKEVGQAKIIG